MSFAKSASAALNFLSEARSVVASKVISDGKLNSKLLDREQRAVHGLAWIATTVEALVQTAAWAERLQARQALCEAETLLLQIGFGEYLAQLVGGLPMSQNEFVRPVELGLEAAAARLAKDKAVDLLIRTGNTPQTRAALIKLIYDGMLVTGGRVAAVGSDAHVRAAAPAGAHVRICVAAP